MRTRSLHAFAVGEFDEAGDIMRWGRDIESPIWAELGRLREETLWSRLDTALTVGALVRLGAGTGWMALALATGGESRWGVAMLLFGALSLLHARRRSVLLIADNAGPLAPVIQWLLPYPRVPHVSPVGMLECVGIVVANIGTGWLGGAFEATEASRAAAPAAIALLAIYDVGVAINLTGHVAWELDPAAVFFVRVRPYLAPMCALLELAMMWPGEELGPARPASITLVVVGAVATVAAGTAAGALLVAAAEQETQRVCSVRQATQAVDGRYVHQLKNMARILYRRADEIDSSELRERIRRLCVAISSTEQMLKSGRGQPARCVEEVVNGLLGLDERFAGLRQVDSDLDSRDLTAGDAELVAIAVGDLLSNAVNASAARFRVGLRAEESEHGSWLVLEAECRCGKVLPEIPEDSSLIRLARLLHFNRGTFVISDDGESHRFVLRWPSMSRPRAHGG